MPLSDLIDSFDPAAMRQLQTPHGTSVSRPGNTINFIILKEILEQLIKLSESDTEHFQCHLNQFILKIEGAEKQFFIKKYQSEEIPDDTAIIMASMACQITNNSAQLDVNKLGSLVQHWSAHHTHFGDTHEEYIEVLKQIVKTLKTFPTILQKTAATTTTAAVTQTASSTFGNASKQQNREPAPDLDAGACPGP